MTDLKTPATLNGYPILASAPRSDESIFILAHREGHPYHPFVVASWAPFLGDTWSWGSYFGDLKEAMDYMTDRSNDHAGAS